MTQPNWQRQLLQYAGNDSAIASSLCDAFLQEVPSLLQKIKSTLRSENTDGLHTAIHTLKSCLNYVATADETQLASELEANAKRDDFEMTDQFRSDFARLESIANAWIGRVDGFRSQLKQ